MRAATGVLVARAAWGLTLVTAPERVLGLLQPTRPRTPVAARVVRALGVRHLVQTGAESLVARPAGHYLGAAGDGLHALSGVGLAVLDRRWRQAGLRDSTIAALFGLATALTARTDR